MIELFQVYRCIAPIVCSAAELKTFGKYERYIAFATPEVSTPKGIKAAVTLHGAVGNRLLVKNIPAEAETRITRDGPPSNLPAAVNLQTCWATWRCQRTNVTRALNRYLNETGGGEREREREEKVQCLRHFAATATIVRSRARRYWLGPKTKKLLTRPIFLTRGEKMDKHAPARWHTWKHFAGSLQHDRFPRLNPDRVENPKYFGFESKTKNFTIFSTRSLNSDTSSRRSTRWSFRPDDGWKFISEQPRVASNSIQLESSSRWRQE